MTSRREDPPEARLDMTPIIDVVFNLLIFFMCATKIRQEEGLIRAFLPRDRGLVGGGPVVPANDVRLRVDWRDAAGRRTGPRHGRASVSLGSRLVGRPGDLDGPLPEVSPVWAELQARLVALEAGSVAPPDVVLDAHPAVPTRLVVSALNELVRARLTHVTFAAPAVEDDER